MIKQNQKQPYYPISLKIIIHYFIQYDILNTSFTNYLDNLSKSSSFNDNIDIINTINIDRPKLSDINLFSKNPKLIFKPNTKSTSITTSLTNKDNSRPIDKIKITF